MLCYHYRHPWLTSSSPASLGPLAAGLWPIPLYPLPGTEALSQQAVRNCLRMNKHRKERRNSEISRYLSRPHYGWQGAGWGSKAAGKSRSTMAGPQMVGNPKMRNG